MAYFSTDSKDILCIPPRHLKLNEKSVEKFIRSKFKINTGCKIIIRQFKYGQSNPTYLIELGDFTCVLRKQPPGKLVKGAHLVEREATIMQRLSGLIPIPKIYTICTDRSIIGTSFYLMEHIQGVIFRNISLPTLSPVQRSQIYNEYIEVLARLHSVDLTRIGLDKSYHRSEYCNRQIKLWSAQYIYNSSVSKREIPEMSEISSWLACHLPEGDKHGTYGGTGSRVIHGDYRLDNIIFSQPKEGDMSHAYRVLAVLDWELSSTGDITTDVAHAMLPYHLPPVGLLRTLSLRPETPSPALLEHHANTPSAEGIPCQQSFLQHYYQTRNTLMHTTLSAPSPSDWVFYLVLALFRSASILCGVYARAIQGNAAQKSQAIEVSEMIPVIARTALLLSHAVSYPPMSLSHGVEDHPRALRTDNKEMKTLRTSSNHVSHLSDLSIRCRDTLQTLREFIQKDVLPVERVLLEHYSTAQGRWPNRGDRWTLHPILNELCNKARLRGLWNLWMPSHLCSHLQHTHKHWDWSSIMPHYSPGVQKNSVDISNQGKEIETKTEREMNEKLCAFTNLEYAHLAIATGFALWTAESLNCSAPDTGNMEILGRFGTPAQRERWLLPLLMGQTRSCFAMTEPEVASSDPTQLMAEACEVEGGWRVTGRKWWTSGACDPRCDCCLFIGRTGAINDPPHSRHSLFVFPLSSAGVTVEEPLTVFGYDDAPHGHPEVRFKEVRISSDSLIGEKGRGFLYAQTRLAPGRLHHCCRLIGHGERALQEAVARGSSRKAFGKTLIELGGNSERLAVVKIALQQARLAVLNAAAELDKLPGIGAELSDDAIEALSVAKVAAPQAVTLCLDLAIQLHGGEGLTSRTPLAAMFAATRALRLVDGADEVHIRSVMKLQKKESMMLIGPRPYKNLHSKL